MIQYIRSGILFISVELTLPVLFQVELKENRKFLATGALIMVMLGMTTCTFGILSPVFDNCRDTTQHITPITSSIQVLMNPNDTNLADAETPEKQLEKLRLFMPASKA